MIAVLGNLHIQSRERIGTSNINCINSCMMQLSVLEGSHRWMVNHYSDVVELGVTVWIMVLSYKTVLLCFNVINLLRGLVRS